MHTAYTTQFQFKLQFPVFQLSKHNEPQRATRMFTGLPSKERQGEERGVSNAIYNCK